LTVARGEKLPISRGAGLTAKGRAKYNRLTGANLKAPQPGGGKRKDSFCARMAGVVRHSRGDAPRARAALRRWKCPGWEDNLGKENPTMKRKPTPAQIAARERFAEMARSGAFKRRVKRNPSIGIKRKRKSITRRSQATGRAPTRRLIMRRRATAALRQRGYFANPGRKSPTRALDTDSPIYRDRVRVRGWNVPVSPLMDADVGGKLLRARLPEFSKGNHESAARYFLNENKRLQGAWSALIGREHRRVFGKEFRPEDYKISGIGREEYSESVKDKLRALARAESDAGSAAAAHWRAAGKRLFTLRSNPGRKSLTRRSQATGRAPTSRLVMRRRKTLRAPKGFFANPNSRLYRVLERRPSASSWSPVGSFLNRERAMQYARAYHKAAASPVAVKVMTG